MLQRIRVDLPQSKNEFGLIILDEIPAVRLETEEA
jgi:hypothetical protein